MVYNPQVFTNDITVLKAEHLNHIEKGIVDLNNEKLNADQLDTAIDVALQTAKDSGEFTGEQGVSVTGININSSGYLMVTLSDGQEINAGLIPSGSGGDGSGGTGADGVGIQSIGKTGTEGLVDTYTITLTDGSTYDFTVTNGADGSDATVTVDQEVTETGENPVSGAAVYAYVQEHGGGSEEPVWYDLPYNSSMVTNTGAMYTKVNNIVSIQGTLKLVSTLANGTTITIATMPEGFRPKKTVTTVRNMGGAWFNLSLQPDGVFKMTHYQSNAMSNNYSFYTNIEYVVGN